MGFEAILHVPGVERGEKRSSSKYSGSAKKRKC
jgi:hypothetical protein